jgi:hypothetical protein
VTHARIIWPPYPYEAGFCITDDPDASTLAQTRTVYDYLMKKSFVTTKAVWAFEPEMRCGIPPIPDSALRGITLADPNFASYCKELHHNGFELCLHGASVSFQNITDHPIPLFVIRKIPTTFIGKKKQPRYFPLDRCCLFIPNINARARLQVVPITGGTCAIQRSTKYVSTGRDVAIP